MRKFLRRMAERPPSIESVMTHPPGAPPKSGYARQQALPHINWNEFGPKGTEHNWVDLPTMPREKLGT